MSTEVTNEQKNSVIQEFKYACDAIKWLGKSEQEIFELLHTPDDVGQFSSDLISVQVALEHCTTLSTTRDLLAEFACLALHVRDAFSILTPQREKWSTPYLIKQLSRDERSHRHYALQLHQLTSYEKDRSTFLSQNPNGEEEIQQLRSQGGMEFYTHNSNRTQRAIDEIRKILISRGIVV